MTAEIAIAKQELREALANNQGDTKAAPVVEAIAALAALNPTTTPAHNAAFQDGEWLLINAPNFPGGVLQENGKRRYTLGRLAFNMFQPTGLRLEIDQVWQPVLPTGLGDQRTHDIIVSFTTVDDAWPTLKGIVKNLGVCEPKTEDEISVQFTGGVLCPSPKQDLDSWRQVFGSGKMRSPTALKDKAMNLFLKLMFGLQKPSPIDPQTGEIRFEMTRSPRGTLKILYLDEELRITKGEKGTVLVCERQHRGAL